MNKIFETQEKLRELVKEYDQIVKHNVQVEVAYNKELGELIQQTLIYEGQCHIYAVALDNKDKDIEEVKTLVNEEKDKLVNHITRYVNKLANFKKIIENNEKYSEEEIAKLDADFFEVLTKYHPGISLNEIEKAKAGYGVLRNLYIENNVDTYFEIKEQIPFKEYELKNEEEDLNQLNEILASYIEEKERIEKYNENFKTLEEVLADDMLIAKEESALRERIYVAKNKLKELAEEANNVFGGEIEFKYN